MSAATPQSATGPSPSELTAGNRTVRSGDALTPAARRLFVVLRAAVALCFIGHGAFGIIGKQEWLPYFAIAGIGETLAWRLMPVIGSVDILIGVLALARPCRALFTYAAVWTLLTAALRPLAGESVFEALERAGNYGIPIAILAWAGRPLTVRGAFARMAAPMLDPIALVRLRRILIGTTVLLLAGHGGLGLFVQKALLAEHYAALGMSAHVVPAIGALEIALAILIVIRPAPGLLIGALIWKLATEALFPIAGAPIWEFIERGGSYVAPLAAAWLVHGSLLPSRARLRVPVPGTVVAAGALVLLPGAFAPPADGLRSVAVRELRQDTTLLGNLRGGGLVLACRHALTDHSREDRRPIDLADRSTQRNLSEAGEAQARALGAEIRRLGLPIGEVLASPYARTRESAELAFERVTLHDALAFGGSDAEFRTLLSQPPDAGRNRVIVSHAGRMFRVLDQKAVGGLNEGDCAVIRPLGDAFDVLGRIRAREWATLR